MFAAREGETNLTMTPAHSSAVAEWRAHWPMVAAAMAGLSFTTVGVYSIGLFMEPLAREFGWTRAQISARLSIVALFAVLVSLPVGALIDRSGSRRLAIPGVILTSFAFAAFASANGSLRQWFALWMCGGIVAVAIKTTVWTAAMASLFAASRALALAVVLCGAALSQTIAPLLAQWLIDDCGWRTAFLGMGIGWGACVLVLLPFFFDARDYGEGKRVAASVISNGQTAAGLTWREGLRNPAILRIATALTISTVMGVGIDVHKVPILDEAGISREFAARLALAAGVAGIVG
jgi:MFS family permease